MPFKMILAGSHIAFFLLFSWVYMGMAVLASFGISQITQTELVGSVVSVGVFIGVAVFAHIRFNRWLNSDLKGKDGGYLQSLLMPYKD